jgi:hypothetical protein
MKVRRSWMRFESDSCSFKIILMGRQRIMMSKIVLDAAVASNSISLLMQCGTLARSILQKSEIGVHSNKVMKKATMVQMATMEPTI